MSLSWLSLLSKQRLGQPELNTSPASRTDFQKDFDRIVFSSAFRRMQDKTQVFPLTRNDYVRTRLTHSLEVSSIGRSLGVLAGETLIERHALTGISAADFGAIVAAACLAHDIGNPPFGHTGENAIRHWINKRGAAVLASLQSGAEQADLQRFEGNAQGFRILSRLQNAVNRGGMQLTCATLGAFSKYPQAAYLPPEVPSPYPKHGFFADDQAAFGEVAQQLGLIQQGTAPLWCRHPLAYLMEAADDLCYRIIDIEDGYRAGYFHFNETRELLLALLPQPQRRRMLELGNPHDTIESLRAKAINSCINQVFTCFLDQEPTLLQGITLPRLVTQIPSAQALQQLQEVATQTIYIAREVVEVGAAGFQVIGGLLSAFYEAVETLASGQHCPYSQTLLHLLPQPPAPQATAYQRLLAVTDFVSGMTDSYAVSLYKRLTGISLP